MREFQTLAGRPISAECVHRGTSRTRTHESTRRLKPLPRTKFAGGVALDAVKDELGEVIKVSIKRVIAHFWKGLSVALESAQIQVEPNAVPLSRCAEQKPPHQNPSRPVRRAFPWRTDEPHGHAPGRADSNDWVAGLTCRYWEDEMRSSPVGNIPISFTGCLFKHEQAQERDQSTSPAVSGL